MEDITYFDDLPFEEEEEEEACKKMKEQIKAEGIKWANGNYRCPACTGKLKKEFELQHLLEHARATWQVNGDARTRGVHKAIYEAAAAENDKQKSKEKAESIEVLPPVPPVTKEVAYAWPWKAMVQTPITNLKGPKEGPTRERLFESFKQFHVREARVFYDRDGHTGVGLVIFGEEAMGLQAEMLEKSFKQDGHGRQDWFLNYSETRKDFYAWLVTKADMQSEKTLPFDGSGNPKASRWPPSLKNYFQKHTCTKTFSEAEEYERQRANLRLEAVKKTHEEDLLKIEAAAKREEGEERNKRQRLEESRALLAEKHEVLRKNCVKNLMTETSTKIGLYLTADLNAKKWMSEFEKRGKSEEECAKLLSKWQDKIAFPHFMPLKTILENGKEKRVVDSGNVELLQLKTEYGEEVYDDVVRAVFEREEYNASGNYCIEIPWNFTKKRMATLGEVLDYCGECFQIAENGRRKKTQKRR